MFKFWGKASDSYMMSDQTLMLISIKRNENGKVNRQLRVYLVLIVNPLIKSAPFVCQDKGIDANKRVNGRKRHLIVDTLGLVWGVVVHGAEVADGTKAHLLVEHCLG